MALTGHSDALFIPWIINPILLGNFQIYSFLEAIREAHGNANSSFIWAPNPPLTYFTLAAWMWLLKITSVLDTAGWSYEAISFSKVFAITRMLFVTKALYLFIDLTIWSMLRDLVERSRRKLVDWLWLLSPVTLIGIYIMGQTDVLSIFWVVLFLVIARRIFLDEKPEPWLPFLAMFVLGMGAAYKLWALFLIPAAVLLLDSQLKRRLGLFVVGILPLFITLIPFLSDPAFQDSVLLSHSIGFLTKDQPIWLQNHSRFILCWAGLHFSLFFFPRKWRFFELCMVFFAILLAFFTLNSFWEFYWFSWLMPFIILAVAHTPENLILHLVQLVHNLFYMIAGWDIGGEVLLRGILTPRRPETIRPRVALFGEELRLMWVLVPVLFNLFVASSWGMAVLTALNEWKPTVRAELREKALQARWLLWIPPVLFLLYVVWANHLNNSWFFADRETALTYIQATIARDNHFFLGWLALCLVPVAILSYRLIKRIMLEIKSRFPQRIHFSR